MKKYILLVLLLIAYFSGRAQLTFDASKLNDSILAICNQMVADSIVRGEHYNVFPLTTEQWKLYKQLQIIATDSMFVELTNLPSYIIRWYAFEHLFHRSSPYLFDALKKNENDTIIGVYQKGCIPYMAPLIDYIISDMYRYY